MADSESSPLLNLDTLSDRAIVTINKQPYPLRRSDEMSLMESRRLQRLSKRYYELFDKPEDLTAAEEAEFSSVAQDFCAAVLMAPAEVLDSLRDPHRMAIVRTFTMLLFESLLRAGAVKKETPAVTDVPSIGASGSPA